MKIVCTLTTAALLASLTGLAACGADADRTASAGKTWAFTDGRGTRISLDHAPSRIVAQSSIAAALKDDGVDVVGVFGPLKGKDGQVDPQAAGLDPSAVTDVTGTGEYGDLEMEELVGLRPDLLVTNMFVPPELWYVNKATETKVDGLTKTLAIDFQGKSLVETIEAVGTVAKALGGNDGAADKAAFDDASARLRDVGRRLGDRKVLVVSATTDLLYVADPSQFPDLAYFRSLGLPVVAATAKAGSYWDEVSWEKADKYGGDVVLWDSRDGQGTLDLLRRQPVFGQVAGARAGRYVAWQAVAPPSYRAYAAVMNALADKLEASVR
ncbi:MAG: ABC transporter substrate-binding protein [Nocardioidaceae bacterium]|nr:ABC transporter substrate-binding protein [Nocardioidaceae bacterium]